LGRPVESPVSTKIADGIACRLPELSARELIWKGVEKIVQVSDIEIVESMRIMCECTQNVCEGAVAAAIAAALKESSKNKGLKVAVIASGGNVDPDVFAKILVWRKFRRMKKENQSDTFKVYSGTFLERELFPSYGGAQRCGHS
jgi:threonine dehydratase